MVLIAFLKLSDARLTEEEQEEIVRAHNYYRGKVDPIATNMEQMVMRHYYILCISLTILTDIIFYLYAGMG